MEKLENGDTQDHKKAVEAASEKADIELLGMCFKSELQNLETEISTVEATIHNLEDSSISIFSKTLYDAQITELSSRLTDSLVVKTNKVLVAPEESSDSSSSNESIENKLESFINTQQVKLGSCSSTLIQKVKSDLTTLELKHPVTPSSTTPDSQFRPREQVQLEKTKPPKFNGEDIEFPEFQRKWTSLVTKANLSEETELDKLRDNIPKEAMEQLFGVKSLSESWKILYTRYGDSMIISRKLKLQLKNIETTGKNDPERVINLKVKVRNIVTRLEALNMQEALNQKFSFILLIPLAAPFPLSDNLVWFGRSHPLVWSRY